jgi:hypothetical protein
MGFFPLEGIALVDTGDLPHIYSFSRCVQLPNAGDMQADEPDRSYIIYSTLLACPFFVFVYPLLAVRRSFITSAFPATAKSPELIKRPRSRNTSVQLIQDRFDLSASSKERSACWSLCPGISGIYGFLLLLLET